MSSEEPPILSHSFQSYQWDESRCGYVYASDDMCGYFKGEHAIHLGHLARGDSIDLREIPELQDGTITIIWDE